MVQLTTQLGKMPVESYAMAFPCERRRSSLRLMMPLLSRKVQKALRNVFNFYVARAYRTETALNNVSIKLARISR